ncbi:hypothetical protein SMICM304S_02837 [Streptomyces microflavus]
MGIPIRRGSTQKPTGSLRPPPHHLRLRPDRADPRGRRDGPAGGLAERRKHPVAVGALIVPVLAAAAVVLRRRRRARRVAGAVTDAAYGIVDAGLAELDAAQAARRERRPEPPEAAIRSTTRHWTRTPSRRPWPNSAGDGCADAEVVGGAGDLGADVLATTPDGRRLVVQRKRYGPTTGPDRRSSSASAAPATRCTGRTSRSSSPPAVSPTRARLRRAVRDPLLRPRGAGLLAARRGAAARGVRWRPRPKKTYPVSAP